MYAQYGSRLGIIHTDNAPEYGRGPKGDIDMINFMLDHGMKPFSTGPYDHEQALIDTMLLARSARCCADLGPFTGDDVNIKYD